MIIIRNLNLISVQSWTCLLLTMWPCNLISPYNINISSSKKVVRDKENHKLSVIALT